MATGATTDTIYNGGFMLSIDPDEFSAADRDTRLKRLDTEFDAVCRDLRRGLHEWAKEKGHI